MESITKEHDDSASIVVPERVPVKDLRAWLANFGQANKHHYEKGKLLTKQQQVAIQSRIHSLEEVLGSPSSYANSSSNNSQVPAGQLTWESPVKPAPPVALGNEPKTPPSTMEEERTTNSPKQNTKAASGRDFGDEEEREQPSPNSVLKASFTDPIDALEGERSPETSKFNQDEATEEESSWEHPSEVEQGIEVLNLMEESIPSNGDDYCHNVTRKVESPCCPPKPTGTSPTNGSSKIYRFEPVRQASRMRVVGVERLLEPPVPTRRANDTWEDDYEDEWADDFSEPCFPQAHHRVTMRTNGLQTTAGAASAWEKTDVRPQVGYSVDSHGYDDEDDDEDDDDCSLLDSVSIATGRYTDPGSYHQQSRRPKARKNRFPLWLCHKRKHAVPYDEEADDHYFPDDDDNYAEHFEMQVQDPLVATPVTLYESPPRPKQVVHSTNFLPDGVLTKSTLDLLCCPNEQEDFSPPLSLPAEHATTTTTFLPNIPERRHVLDDREELDATSSRRSSRSSTTATSNNSRDAPAILPGAVQDPLRDVLARDNNNNRIAKAAVKWGGSARNNTTVAHRRRQLQQALERDKPISHVKRIQWQVCPSTGLYKKKIIVEPTSLASSSKK